MHNGDVEFIHSHVSSLEATDCHEIWYLLGEMNFGSYWTDIKLSYTILNLNLTIS